MSPLSDALLSIAMFILSFSIRDDSHSTLTVSSSVWIFKHDCYKRNFLLSCACVRGGQGVLTPLIPWRDAGIVIFHVSGTRFTDIFLL